MTPCVTPLQTVAYVTFRPQELWPPRRAPINHVPFDPAVPYVTGGHLPVSALRAQRDRAADGLRQRQRQGATKYARHSVAFVTSNCGWPPSTVASRLPTSGRLRDTRFSPVTPVTSVTSVMSITTVMPVTADMPVPAVTAVPPVPQVPDLESCRPVKDLVLEVMVKDEWRRLIGFRRRT